MADDLRSTLERVGERFDLGEYEVDAYLAVLEHGELTASGIAERTDVPQPRVYDTVRSLADRGLVELRESRPMRVRAVDPEEALGDVRTSLDELVDGLSARYTAPTRAEAGATLVKSRSTILRYLGEVIGAADYELAVSVTPDLLRRFRGALADTRASGASVELLVTPAGRAPPPEEFPYAEVATDARARRGITTPVLAVADGEYSVYATQDALREDRERYGVIFDRSALGFLVSAFFGTVLWSTADPLAADRADRPFPRRYASIRRAIKELRGVEGDLYATVVGRDVETGSDRTVRGRIADADLADTGEVASLTIETGGGTAGDRVTVGGLVAAFEDVEAREISVGRGAPPER